MTAEPVSNAGRKRWKTEHLTPDPAAAMAARAAVSTRARDYGNPDQIDAAIAELHAAWAALEGPLRKANATARALLPTFGQPLTSQADADAHLAALDALPAPLRELVDDATRIRQERHTIAFWSGRLIAGRLGAGQEVPPLLLDDERFRVASGLFRRLTAARNTALAEYLCAVEARPVDDLAWFAEQARRAGLIEEAVTAAAGASLPQLVLDATLTAIATSNAVLLGHRAASAVLLDGADRDHVIAALSVMVAVLLTGREDPAGLLRALADTVITQRMEAD